MWKCTVSFSNWGKWKPEKQDGPVNTRWAELSLKPDKGRLERLPCATEIPYKSDFFIFCFLKEAQWYKENAFLKGMLYLGDTIFKTFHRTSIFYNLRTKIKKRSFPCSPPPPNTHTQSWISKGEEIQGVSTDIAFRCVVLACVLTDLFLKQSLKNALCASEVTS